MKSIFCRMTGFPAAILILFYLSQITAYAQVADTLRLDEVVIEASRLSVPWNLQPVHVSLVDSAQISGSGSRTLGQALEFSSPVIIRSYGSGGLASVSSRGFGPRQTQLVWNGFVMNHAMLGESDYNLIPASMVSNLRVATGNSSTGYGSGVAGSVIMDAPVPQNRTRISINQGAWGRFGTDFVTGINTGRYYAGFAFTGNQATNDYPYFDQIRQQERNRRNNFYRNQHLLLTGGFRLGNWMYDSAFWTGSATHHIAGSVTTGNPRAWQDDNFRNWSHSLRWLSGFGTIELSGLFSRYDLDYTDPATNINSDSQTGRMSYRLVYRHQVLDFWHLAAGSEFSRVNVETNNYRDLKTRRSGAFFLSNEITPVSFLRIYPAARLETTSDFGRALTGSIGLNANTPLSWLTVRASASSNYAAPTLNDLYWSPGGNPDLKPERSRSFETGLTADWRKDFGRIRAAVTWFTMDFENGIRWQPAGGGIWSPVNITEIKSRGFESEISGIFRYRSWEGRVSFVAAYTRATSPQRGAEPDTFIDKQLPYVPEWSRKATFGISRNPIFVNLSWQSVSERFTTNDHSSPLDPLDSYSVLNLQAGLNLHYAKFDGRISYTLHNLRDKEYQVIAWYPMPQRYHTITLSFSINH